MHGRRLHHPCLSPLSSHLNYEKLIFNADYSHIPSLRECLSLWQEQQNSDSDEWVVSHQPTQCRAVSPWRLANHSWLIRNLSTKWAFTRNFMVTLNPALTHDVQSAEWPHLTAVHPLYCQYALIAHNSGWAATPAVPQGRCVRRDSNPVSSQVWIDVPDIDSPPVEGRTERACVGVEEVQCFWEPIEHSYLRTYFILFI